MRYRRPRREEELKGKSQIRFQRISDLGTRLELLRARRLGYFIKCYGSSIHPTERFSFSLKLLDIADKKKLIFLVFSVDYSVIPY